MGAESVGAAGPALCAQDGPAAPVAGSRALAGLETGVSRICAYRGG